MSSDFLRVQAARESGAVSRAHIMHTSRPYDIAQHCYNMAAMLMILHPNPSKELIKSVLFHDIAERWTGDVPHPIKASNLKLRRLIENKEVEIQTELGLLVQLHEVDEWWLGSLDTFELYLFSLDEISNRGNLEVLEMKEKCEDYLETRIFMNTMPHPIRELFYIYRDKYNNNIRYRLSDDWENVRRLF